MYGWCHMTEDGWCHMTGYTQINQSLAIQFQFYTPVARHDNMSPSIARWTVNEFWQYTPKLSFLGQGLLVYRFSQGYIQIKFTLKCLSYCTFLRTPLWKSNRNLFSTHIFYNLFLLFVLIFIHDICEVVNIKSTDFCCISIIGYTSVTFWKRLLGQNPMSH